MFKSDEENLQQELLALREENKLVKQKLLRLEETIEEQSETLNAQENVNELAQSERFFAEATIKAYEKVIELSRKELSTFLSIIKAQDHLQDYSRNKKVFLDTMINAFTNVLELSRKELDEAYKTIGAYEKVNELSRKELIEVIEKLKNMKTQSMGSR